MYLTGFADEAAQDLETQIKATQEIGWTRISARGVNGANLHELPQEEFDKVADQLDATGISTPLSLRSKCVFKALPPKAKSKFLAARRNDSRRCGKASIMQASKEKSVTISPRNPGRLGLCSL